MPGTLRCLRGKHFYGEFGSVGNVKRFCQRCGHVEGQPRHRARPLKDVQARRHTQTKACKHCGCVD